MSDPVRRAERARQLLDDETIKWAFEQIETDCIAQWRGSSALSIKKREKLYHELRELDALKAKLQSAVDDAQIRAASRT